MSPHRIQGREIVLGVDGGGTKTHAIITDVRQRVLGEGTSGPSNPLRIGIGNAATAIREAIDRACAKARVQRADIVAAEIGLAGVRRGDLRLRMREALSGLGIHSIEVVTDADIALFGATGGQPGLVIIAGTGSVCCGINAQGKRVYAGGWGPLAGDEGSGSWIARRALQAVARAGDGRGTETVLAEAALSYFNVATTDDLLIALYAPGMTNERIAGFGKQVTEAAKSGDEVAREIVVNAGRELGVAAVAVIRKLRMGRERFQVGYVGGVFAAGDLLLDPLREEITRVAPNAFLAPPKLPPAVAAARMAREHLHRFPVAV
ncbi:MAG TPA: BadF/BadG/BcrA/BcrD ATPase family protein [Pyrinomonadaceae bacterium]|nr:BadF/BadG/BcrA/BcrD ATPase family protein [Pyrinomonadaceae bacterium]